MGYFVCYGTSDREEPTDGDQVASTLGWDRFARWAEDLPEGYDETYYLATEGGVEDVAKLQQELERAAAEKPNGLAGDNLSVLLALLAAVKAAPPNCDCILVSDGTPGSGSDDDD